MNELHEVAGDEMRTVEGGYDFGLGALIQFAASALEGKAMTTPTSQPVVSGTSSHSQQSGPSTRIADAYAQQRQ